MAMIKCPECGQDISDRAEKCPKCGYPLKIEGAQRKSDKKKKSKKIVIGIMVVLFVLGVVIFNFYRSTIQNNILVKNVDISKWKLIDEGNFFDKYEALVTSDVKKPFIAVIGYYEKSNDPPKLVYMDNGEGTLNTNEGEKDDPSIKYKGIGYIGGKTVKDIDVKKISCKDNDYEDWNDDTSCSVDITIEMKKTETGILFVEITNDLTNEVTKNVMIVLNKGKGEYNYNLSELPLKARGVEVNVTPKFFCRAESIKKAEYKIDKKFSIEKNTGDYSTSYEGMGELSFNNYEEGLLIYTEELIDGGKKEERGKVYSKGTYIKGGKSVISTYVEANNDDKLLKPKYDVRIIGGIKFNDLKDE